MNSPTVLLTISLLQSNKGGFPDQTSPLPIASPLAIASPPPITQGRGFLISICGPDHFFIPFLIENTLEWHLGYWHAGVPALATVSELADFIYVNPMRIDDRLTSFIIAIWSTYSTFVIMINVQSVGFFTPLTYRVQPKQGSYIKSYYTKTFPGA